MRWISLILILVLAFDLWSHRPVDEISFLQVGQGDATFISKNGSHLLIDAGPASPNFDGGIRFVWPELRNRGVNRLDAVLITHFDRDHYGGLKGLLTKIRIDRIIAVMPGGLDAEQLTILAEIGVRTDQLIVIESAQRVTVADIELAVVPGWPGSDDNELSPLIRTAIGGTEVVITGDASSLSEGKWIELGVESADIVKAGHHGSDRSLSTAWIEAIRPKYVIFSCGRNNQWGHPSINAIERAEKSGAAAMRTDASGTIQFRADSRGQLQLVSREDRPAFLKLFER